MDEKSEDIHPFTVKKFDYQGWTSKKSYLRNLPHWELTGSTYFITSRVDSRVDKPFLYRHIAEQMSSILVRDHKKKYYLHAYVIMPDHLHILITPYVDQSLANIMQNIKGFSAYCINKLLNRKGKFWQNENFDHLIRDSEGFVEKWEYIKQNPVKGNLCANAEDYPFSSFYSPK